MKRSIEGFNQLNTIDKEANRKLELQNLLNEFLELQKEFVSKKRKLQAAKQRRDNILGEILFLKQRHRYLLKSQSSRVDGERNIPNMNNFNPENEVLEEERPYSDYNAAGETARPAFASKFNSGYEVGDEDVLAGRDVLRSMLLGHSENVADTCRILQK